MDAFFSDNILLRGTTAKVLYEKVKNLPIIDCHCHLNEVEIFEDTIYEDIGELWLKHDHYKWRAMRICGVQENLITGTASFRDKFVAFATIMPKLIGSQLYYWCHLELKNVFGINVALNADSAEKIYNETKIKLKKLPVNTLLKNFKVEYLATTNNPAESLAHHKTYGKLVVAPTFRADGVLALDDLHISKLGAAAESKVDTLADVKAALVKRLDFFVEKGCRITDHGFQNFPKNYLDDEAASEVYANRANATQEQKDGAFANLLLFLMRQYKKRGLIAQLHFAVKRNINSFMFKKLGADSGFDVAANECDLCDVMKFLDKLDDEERPTTILYTLNSNSSKALATICGSFKNVHLGAAWWFNDTLEGIKESLSLLAEYNCLGTHLGMLTDSRSFISYSRFDFFRRILCSFIGRKVDKGEYNAKDAAQLAEDICYNNIKNLLKI